MLYCKSCKYVVEAGDNQCRNCGNGFVSALVCGGCSREVPRGSVSCPTCDRHTGGVGVVPRQSGVVVAVVPYGGGQLQHPEPMLPALPGLPMGLPPPVRESYVQRSFGVESEVVLNTGDADILNKMNQAAALLQVLAAEMNKLQGHMPSTREVIKGCRKLSLELQEEVEVRLGPQGAISG